MKPIADLVGRILIVAIFLFSGINKIKNFEGTAGYMKSNGMNSMTDFLLVGAIICLILGSILVLSGYQSKLGAGLLLLFLLPATFIFHDFWSFPEAEQGMQRIQFFKNLALAGGLLLLVANGAGKYSIKTLIKRV